VRLALAQLDCRLGDPDANGQRAAGVVREAVAGGAEARGRSARRGSSRTRRGSRRRSFFVDVDLDKVDARRRELPLLGDPRLDVLRAELDRLAVRSARS